MTRRNRATGNGRAPAYVAGLVVSLGAIALLLLPGQERLHALGPANPGHQDLKCADCHRPAPGTVRQQIQANVRHALGLRETGAAFVHRAAENEDCLACHSNEVDRHPTHRFEEPRFAEVREAIAPQRCGSCHVEHSGRRMSAAATICSHCHAELKMSDDPIEPSHAQLARDSLWGTCLQCHDFHGNHVRQTPRRLEEAATAEEVERYLLDGPDPYGREVRFPARTDRGDS